LITPPKRSSHQFESGKKKREQNKRRRYEEYILIKKRMEAKDKRIADLERKCDSLRKNLERQKEKNTKSLRSLVKCIIKKKDAKAVRIKLLFGETLKRQIKENLQTRKCRKDKHSFVSNIVGDAKWLRKYGLLQTCDFIPPKILRSKVGNGAYNRRIKTIFSTVRADVEAFL